MSSSSLPVETVRRSVGWRSGSASEGSGRVWRAGLRQAKGMQGLLHSTLLSVEKDREPGSTGSCAGKASAMYSWWMREESAGKRLLRSALPAVAEPRRPFGLQDCSRWRWDDRSQRLPSGDKSRPSERAAYWKDQGTSACYVQDAWTPIAQERECPPQKWGSVRQRPSKSRIVGNDATVRSASVGLAGVRPRDPRSIRATGT